MKPWYQRQREARTAAQRPRSIWVSKNGSRITIISLLVALASLATAAVSSYSAYSNLRILRWQDSSYFRANRYNARLEAFKSVVNRLPIKITRLLQEVDRFEVDAPSREKVRHLLDEEQDIERDLLADSVVWDIGTINEMRDIPLAIGDFLYCRIKKKYYIPYGLPISHEQVTKRPLTDKDCAALTYPVVTAIVRVRFENITSRAVAFLRTGMDQTDPKPLQ